MLQILLKSTSSWKTAAARNPPRSCCRNCADALKKWSKKMDKLLSISHLSIWATPWDASWSQICRRAKCLDTFQLPASCCLSSPISPTDSNSISLFWRKYWHQASLMDWNKLKKPSFTYFTSLFGIACTLPWTVSENSSSFYALSHNS